MSQFKATEEKARRSLKKRIFNVKQSHDLTDQSLENNNDVVTAIQPIDNDATKHVSEERLKPCLKTMREQTTALNYLGDWVNYAVFTVLYLC